MSTPARIPAENLTGARLAVRLAALALLTGLLVSISLAAPRDLGRVAPIWPANAVVLICVLRAPGRWRAFLAAGFLGNLAGDLMARDDFAIAFGLSLCNALEVAVCAWLLRSRLGGRLDVRQPEHLKTLRNAALACAAGSALLASIYLGLLDGPNFLVNFAVWALADALGLMMLTPAIWVLLGLRAHLRERPLTADGAKALAFFAVVCVGVFMQDRYPLLFLSPVAMLMVGVTQEALGAAVAALFSAAAAIGFTFAGHGPFMLIHGGWSERLILMQLFVVITSALGFQAGAIHAQRRRAQAKAELSAARAREAERRMAESEGLYRLLAENATDAIARTRLDSELLYLSPAAFSLSGYRPDELVGRRALDLMHPEDQARVRQAYQRLIASKGAAGPLRVEYRLRRKDGGYVWIEASPRLVVDAAGEPVEFVDVGRDVSVRKAAEAELRQARAAAEAAAGAKAEFLANMSHELRTPLTSIVGFTRLAIGQPGLPEAARRCVEKVEDASRALLCAVNDILDFSKLEAGQVTISPVPTALRPLCQSALDLFLPQAGAKDLALTLDFRAPADLVVRIDPDRVRQILLNLLGNAVKFTADGGVALRVEHDAGGGRLHVAVTDTGPGVPRERRDQLFQRFAQVDGDLARAHGGTGLGLAICRGLAEAMGGGVGMVSPPGGGSTFWFEIAAPVTAETPADAAPEAPGGATGGLRVLVVDDHRANRELARLFLGAAGAEVSEAEGGADALAQADAVVFDVILMDLRMPGMSGAQALAALRQGDGPNRATPVLAFSADAVALHAELLDAGFAEVVAKPLEPQALIQAVSRAVAVAPAPPEGLADVG